MEKRRDDLERDPRDDLSKERNLVEGPPAELDQDVLPDADDDELVLDGPLELDDDELLAESEYNVRTANREPYPVTSGGNRRLGLHREEDISVRPEELGRRALEEATQDFHLRTEDDELAEAEWPHLRWGEEQMVETVTEDESEQDRLLSQLGESTEAEERISDEAERELESRRQYRIRGRRSRHRGSR